MRGAESKMDTMLDIYLPREDSFLMQETIRRHRHLIEDKVVIDVGTGSGILAIEAAKHARLVVSSDISRRAIEYARKMVEKCELKNIYFMMCDLTSAIRHADVIIFNPPYLPEDETYAKIYGKDDALDGGKEGYEIIVRFLKEFEKLNARTCFILFSSLSKPEKILRCIKSREVKFEKVAQKKLFFEELYVYILTKRV